jgi:hypothetical protein
MCQTDGELVEALRERGNTDQEIFGYYTATLEYPEAEAREALSGLIDLPASDQEADETLASDENAPEVEPSPAPSLGAQEGYGEPVPEPTGSEVWDTYNTRDRQPI